MKGLHKNSYKKHINYKIRFYAFNSLMKKSSKHSKSTQIASQMSFKSFRMQPYLLSQSIIKEGGLLFVLRTRSLPLKINRRMVYDEDVTCQLCRGKNYHEEENHLLLCRPWPPHYHPTAVTRPKLIIISLPTLYQLSIYSETRISRPNLVGSSGNFQCMATVGKKS